MNLGRFAVIALLAVAAVGVTAGTADALPARTAAGDPSASGIDRGVAYTTTISEPSGSYGEDSVLTTVVDGGRFELSDGGDTVSLVSATGTVVTDVPLAFDVSGHPLRLAHEIGADGRTLTLTPEASAEDIGELQRTGSMDRLMAEVDKNVVGMVAGGVLGGLIGAVAGMFFLSWITAPIGVVLGAAAGGAIMGGQPFIDAMTAAITGQP